MQYTILFSILGLVVGLSNTSCTTEHITKHEAGSQMSDWDDEGLRNNSSPKKKGWSGSGRLRCNTQQTEPPPKSITLQANFGDDVGMHTVQLWIDRPPFDLNFPAFVVEAEALVTWSVAGNQISRRVTVGNGVSISGSAEAVHVSVFDKSVSAPGPPTDIEYDVTILVVKGQRAANVVPPTLYAGSFALAPGATTNIAIPQDAGVTSVHVSAGDALFGGATYADGKCEVRQTRDIYTEKVYDCRDVDWEPVAPMATGIAITNRAGVGTSMRFSVTFGIDG